MSLTGLTVLALVLAVALLVSEFGQLWWFGRRSNPDHGPLHREDWEPTTVAMLQPGDVVLSSHLSPNPETVVTVAAGDDERVTLRFRSGRARTINGATTVRRHRPPSASAG